MIIRFRIYTNKKVKRDKDIGKSFCPHCQQEAPFYLAKIKEVTSIHIKKNL